MSIRCQSWVYENSESTGNDRLVLLAIADEADDDGTNAYPGIDRIAHKARVNKRTTMRCIERLEEASELLVERPDVRGRGRYNTYVVLMGRNGDTLSPISEPPGKARNGDRKARKGAPPYLIGSRPIDPQTQDPEVKDLLPDVAFETFWNLYPRKTDKGGAKKAWEKAVKKATIGTVTAGVQRYAADPNLPPPSEAQFIPHASTWLNHERWNDGPLPPRSGKAKPRTADRAMTEDPHYWDDPTPAPEPDQSYWEET